MKRFGIILALIVFGLCEEINAQKLGYIDTEFILNKMPEYRQAQSEIDNLTKAWQKDVEEMQTEVNRLYMAYQSEQVLLTDEMKEDRLGEIEEKEKAMKEFQQQVFGFEGLFFLKKQELIKPLQDKLWEAMDRVAKTNGLAMVFDKAGDVTLIYTDPTHDYTDFVLEELGLGDPNDQIK